MAQFREKVEAMKLDAMRQLTQGDDKSARAQLKAARRVIADFEALEKGGKAPRTLTDAEELKVLRKAVDTSRESAHALDDAGHRERAEEELAVAHFIDQLLPSVLSLTETRKLVDSIIEEQNLSGLGKRGIGRVMGAVKGRLDVDPATVSTVAAQKLG